MGSVLDNSVIVLNIAEELPPMSQNETSLMSKFYRFPVIAAIMFLKCMWTDYFRPGTLGEEGLVPPGSNPDNPPVILNINGEEMLAQTNNQTSFVISVHQFMVRTIELVYRLWTHYFPFTAIKSQGESRFPFHSNPQTITLAINSLIMYGLASEVENVISAARPGPNSVYVLIARLGKKLCLYVLMGAMASLFIL
ncbi:hypothetical protein E3N88_07999 [Mikania micrantha]|uniref:Uncharacterized protein n=1 Tax=Mikania micrantha TaxID=192012 RepID=A0A5N6PF48_9ASTR|nr:hypothetical protein E3N88_07999 [Mikania micrantha]